MADSTPKSEQTLPVSVQPLANGSERQGKGKKMNPSKIKRTNARRIFNSDVKVLVDLLDKTESIVAIEGSIVNVASSFQSLSDCHVEYLCSFDDSEPEDSDYAYIDAPALDKDIAVSKAKEIIDKLGQQRKLEQVQSQVPLDHKKPVIKSKQIELSKFSGNIRDYPAFRRKFETYFNHQSGDYAGLMLKDALIGEAAELTRSIDDSEVSKILEALDRKYGNEQKLLHLIMSDIENLDICSEGNLSHLKKLVQTLELGLCDLRAVKLDSELAHSSTVKIVERRLPHSLKQAWAKIKFEEDLKPKNMFDRLLEFARSALTQAEDVASMDSSGTLSETGQTHRFQGAPAPIPPEFGPPDRCPLHPNTGHFLSQCKKFRAQPVKTKIEILKNEAKNFCYSCLRYGIHPQSKCPPELKCYRNDCDGRHYTFMHDVCALNVDAENSQQTSGTACRHTVSQKSRVTSISPVQCIQVQTPMPHAKGAKLNTLWDTGSNLTLISKKVCERLGLEPLSERATNLTIETVGGSCAQRSVQRYRVPLMNQNNELVCTVIAHAVDDIGTLNRVDLHEVVQIFNLHEDDLIYPEGHIDLLLGSDNAQVFLRHIAEVGGLCLSETPFGKVVWGRHASFATAPSANTVIATVAPPLGTKGNADAVLNSEVRSLFSTETMGVMCIPQCGRCKCGKCQIDGGRLNMQERYELEQIISGMSLENGVITASYPYSGDVSNLSDNYALALKRLIQIEKKLAKNPDLAQLYQEQFNEMLAKGKMIKLQPADISAWQGAVQYLPHNYVLKPSSASTPCRLIFDPSSRYKGQAVNDYWGKGPNLINDVFGVLLRFREYPVAVYADIRKMYHSVNTTPKEWHLHRVLWRDMNTDKEPDIYAITCNSFGSGPAGAVAIAALQFLARHHQESLPRAADTLISQSYVDDLLDSVSTVTAAKQLSADVDQILHSGGFQVKNWTIVGNSETYRTPVAPDLTKNPDMDTVLGLKYNKASDHFSFELSLNFAVKKRGLRTGPDLMPDDIFDTTIVPHLTKRMILSQVNAIFDPIGILAPFVVELKLALGKLWRHQPDLGWDVKVPVQHDELWRTLLNDFFSTKLVTIPRCLSVPGIVGDPTLIAFSDSSMVAFGACCYILWNFPDGSSYSNLIAAKSRMWPIDPDDFLTVCRGELQGAVLATRLVSSIMKESRFTFANVLFVIDSEIVFAQIHMDSHRFTTFVANRIAEIRASTNPNQWFLTRSGDNSCADLLSRGTRDMSLLMKDSTWQTGPSWLKLPRNEWPIYQSRDTQTPVTELRCEDVNVRVMMLQNPAFDEYDSPDTHEVQQDRNVPILGQTFQLLGEIRNIVIPMLKDFTLTQMIYIASLFDLLRRDSLDLLLRITFRVLYALSWTSESNSSFIARLATADVITADQRYSARLFWIRVAQATLDTGIRNGRYKTLTPFRDREGIIRCNGRAGSSPNAYQPILLPNDHPLSRLIVVDFHRRGHGGSTATAARVRSEYHIIKLRSLATKVRNDCHLCKRVEHTFMKAPMGSLPMSRLLPTLPFENCSCDLFGCFHVKLTGKFTRARKVDHAYFKAYGLIITCMSTRSIHLEIMHGQDTEAFLLAFRRFVSLRGQPKSMHSDCGSQLVSADEDLRDMVLNFDSRSLQEYGALNGMKWTYSSPGSPWQNGVSESLIRSVKKTLRTLTNPDTKMSILELQTLLYEVAELLNERPINLGHQGSSGSDYDLRDGGYLCPNQLLLGRCTTRIPSGPFETVDISSENRLLATQTLVGKWWDRWSSEYLPTLVYQSKWFDDARHAKIGDIVHVKDIHPIRGNYNIGEIVEIRPNTENIPRDVLIRYKVPGGNARNSKTYWRDVKNLVLLVPAENRPELSDLIA